MLHGGVCVQTAWFHIFLLDFIFINHNKAHLINKTTTNPFKLIIFFGWKGLIYPEFHNFHWTVLFTYCNIKAKN